MIECELLTAKKNIMIEATTAIGWIAGIVGFGAFIPYFRAILRHKTTPNRATWVIWTLVSTISALSYYASGANHTIWYPISNAVGPFIVLILSIKNGEGGWTKLDRACLAVASFGVFLWLYLGSAIIGLCMSLIADAMGAIPTITKAYMRPQSEDRIAWSLTFSAIVINLFAIENWRSFSLLVYPLYMLIFMGIITILVWLPQRK